MKNLYTKDFLKIMSVSDQFSSMRSNRIEEIINFAKGSKFKNIGLAHCIVFTKEAQLLERYLSNYFQVYRVDCKYGRLTKKDLLGKESSRILCNPAGQADFLNHKNTDLNISMGLCVGHDMIFNKMSNALVTNLFDKDFTNNHNPAEAILKIKQEML